MSSKMGVTDEQLLAGLNQAKEKGELPKGYIPGWLISETAYIEPAEKHYRGQERVLRQNPQDSVEGIDTVTQFTLNPTEESTLGLKDLDCFFCRNSCLWVREDIVIADKILSEERRNRAWRA